MKIIKRNQVVIFVIALMLVTAGYLNFVETNNINNTIQTSSNTESIGDAALVNSGALVENEEIVQKGEKQEEILDVALNIEETAENDKTKDTQKATKIYEEPDEYFTATKLERDNMYSQIIDSYQKMIDGEGVSAEQKAIAQNEIAKTNNTKNAIMITENLIKTKGFKDRTPRRRSARTCGTP